MFINFKRVVKFAFSDFSRNKGISVASIFILVVTTLLLTGIFYMHGISNYLISQIENKIDITAYFKEEIDNQGIEKIKSTILQDVPGVKSVEYISQEQALENFTAKHKDNEVLSKALLEVGDNPFLPSLNIMTSGDAAEYAKIATILQGEEFADIVERVDFSQKKDTIEKIFTITSTINKTGWVLAIILVLIAMTVVYNTLKLAITNSRDEISTMKIVGASSWFIRAPYVIQGVLFGVISWVVCFVITLVVSYFLSKSVSAIMPGFSLFGYTMDNFWLIILIQMGFGVVLGVFSSIIVVRKYLQV